MENFGRYLKGATFGALGFCTSWAIDHQGRGPDWVELVEVELQLRALAEQFHGTRIVHLSDLHCSRTVSTQYLRECVNRVNGLDADIVVLTGDYVTHDCRGRFTEKVVKLISDIRSRLGVYACLGNHDYGIGGTFGRYRSSRVGQMVEGIESAGVTVLRNESSVIELDGRRLRIVGLGDIWADDFEPDKAFSDVSADEIVIALAHNPKSVGHLGAFGFDAIMCGHTHGLRFDWKAPLGRPGLSRRFYYSGMYEIGGRKLYVNRGLGRLGRAFFNTRPEITVFELSPGGFTT